MDFKSRQHELAQQIRTGITDTQDQEVKRRIEVYQELFFNNIESFCATTFPVLKSVFELDQWQKLIRQFFIEHHCETPHFIEISEEFLVFISEHSELLPYPWMIELAHYEWVELAVSTAQTEATDSEIFEMDRLKEYVITVPESSYPLAYNYPVQNVSIDNVEIGPEPTYILVYRNHDLQVQFMNTDALTVHVLSFIQQQEMCYGYSFLAFLLSDKVGLPLSQAQGFLEQALSHLSQRGAICLHIAD